MLQKAAQSARTPKRSRVKEGRSKIRQVLECALSAPLSSASIALKEATFRLLDASVFQRIALRVVPFGVTANGMVLKVKLRKIGNSVGVILPKEALARLNAREGDTIFVTDSADGGIRLTAGSQDFQRKIKSFEGLNRRYRNALKELSK